MANYSTRRRGLFSRILAGAALIGASYIGNNSLESRAYADEPAIAAQQNFNGRAPRNAKEAVEQMFAYELNGRGSRDLGRNAANFYFAGLGAKSNSEIDSAFKAVQGAAKNAENEYASAIGIQPNYSFISSLEARLKSEKEPSQKAYRLIDLIAQAESKQETVMRLRQLQKYDSDHGTSFNEQYRKAIKEMSLILLPSEVEFFLGMKTAEEALKLLEGHHNSSDEIYKKITLGSIVGAGYRSLKNSVFMSKAELSQDMAYANSKPLLDVTYAELDGAIKNNALKSGIASPSLARIPTEEEWEFAARGPANRRNYVTGDNITFKDAYLYTFELIRPIDAPEKTYFSLDEYMKRFPNDVGAFGHVALSGNLHEITLETPRKSITNTDPARKDANERITDEQYFMMTEKGGRVYMSYGGVGPAPATYGAAIALTATLLRRGEDKVVDFISLGTSRIALELPPELDDAAKTEAPPAPPDSSRNIGPK